MLCIARHVKHTKRARAPGANADAILPDVPVATQIMSSIDPSEATITCGQRFYESETMRFFSEATSSIRWCTHVKQSLSLFHSYALFALVEICLMIPSITVTLLLLSPIGDPVNTALFVVTNMTCLVVVLWLTMRGEFARRCFGAPHGLIIGVPLSTQFSIISSQLLTFPRSLSALRRDPSAVLLNRCFSETRLERYNDVIVVLNVDFGLAKGRCMAVYATVIAERVRVIIETNESATVIVVGGTDATTRQILSSPMQINSSVLDEFSDETPLVIEPLIATVDHIDEDSIPGSDLTDTVIVYSTLPKRHIDFVRYLRMRDTTYEFMSLIKYFTHRVIVAM